MKKKLLKEEKLVAVITTALATFLKTVPERFRITGITPANADNKKWKMSARLNSLRK